MKVLVFIQGLIFALLRLLRLVPTPEAVAQRHRLSLPGNQSASMGKTQICTLNGVEVTVRSLTVEDYWTIIPRLDNVLAITTTAFTAGDKVTANALLKAIGSQAKDEFYLVISIASGLDEDFLKSVPLPDMIRYVKALYEVNEVDFVAGEIGAAIRAMVKKYLTASGSLKAAIQEVMTGSSK